VLLIATVYKTAECVVVDEAYKRIYIIQGWGKTGLGLLFVTVCLLNKNIIIINC
jgi:hypothetical protein